MNEKLDRLIAALKANGGDRTDIEVKSAKGGLPDALTPTLSALANLPGGGLIILGLDKANDFAPVKLDDPQMLKQALGNRARNFVPPVMLTIEDGEVDGEPIIAAIVHECDPSAKPCRIKATGSAYLRSYDGDYQLSDLEELAFLSARKAPHFDRVPVTGTSIDDLDRELLAGWLDSVRSDNANALGRFRDNDEVLRRAGIVTSSDELSLAGLLTLGAYPQQYVPRYVIQAAAAPLPGDLPGTRARSAATFDGAIPVMIAGMQRWAAQNMASSIQGDETSGDVHTRYEYPPEAIRELVANALVHRDLDTWSESLAVEVRLRPETFVITNPGGLYGITTDRLGREHVTSARNQRLVNLCQYARLPSGNARVIEGLSTGLPKVAAELNSAALPPAQFIDEGIRFTVLLHGRQIPHRQLESMQKVETEASVLQKGTNLAIVYDALDDVLSVNEIMARTRLSSSSVRTALRCAICGTDTGSLNNMAELVDTPLIDARIPVHKGATTGLFSALY